METKDRIIVALDVDSLDKAKSLVESLAPYVGCFKVGLELLTSVGAPSIVGWFIDNCFGGGPKIFLDAKFHDIPNTMAGAAKGAAGLNVKMFNVHASAGIGAMMAAVANKGQSLVLAVTVLTSLEENNAHLIFGGPSKAKVLQFARDAKIAGCDGIICSPQELELLGKQKELGSLLKITPGVRPEWAAAGDQKRIMTPAEAIKAGATALVIGRPITKPPAEIGTPVDAAKKITEEIVLGLQQRLHLFLFDLQKIKFGAFKLNLHEKNPDAPLSPIYLDIRNLPDSVYTLAGDLLHDLLVREGITDFDYVIGIPKAGEPVGRALAKAVGKPLLRIEKVEHEGGRKISTNILDTFDKDKKVLLVDDLVTKAETKREAIESVEANGLKVVATVVLYDREQGGLQELNAEGRRIYAVARLSDALDFFVKEEKISSSKKEEVVAYIAAN